MTMNFCTLPIPTVYFYVCLWPKRTKLGPMWKKKQIFQIWNNVTVRRWKLFKTKLSSLLFRAHRDSILGRKNQDRSLLTGRIAIGGEPEEKETYVHFYGKVFPDLAQETILLRLPKEIFDDMIVRPVGNRKLTTARQTSFQHSPVFTTTVHGVFSYEKSDFVVKC